MNNVNPTGATLQNSSFPCAGTYCKGSASRCGISFHDGSGTQYCYTCMYLAMREGICAQGYTVDKMALQLYQAVDGDMEMLP